MTWGVYCSSELEVRAESWVVSRAVSEGAMLGRDEGARAGSIRVAVLLFSETGPELLGWLRRFMLPLKKDNFGCFYD